MNVWLNVFLITNYKVVLASLESFCLHLLVGWQLHTQTHTHRERTGDVHLVAPGSTTVLQRQ